MPSLYTSAAMRGFGKYGTIPAKSHQWFISKATFVRGSDAAKRKMKIVRSFKPKSNRKGNKYRNIPNISGLFK